MRIIFCILVSSIAFGDISIKNFGEVVPGVYRGARLSGHEKWYEELRGLGVNEIINLEDSVQDDEDLCQKNSLSCLQYPIHLSLYPGADANFDYEMLKRAFQEVLLLMESGEKIYIHCRAGSDRTGALASAVYIYKNGCGETVDHSKLLKEIDEMLEQYNFHWFLYFNLKNAIEDWAKNPPDWICHPNL